MKYFINGTIIIIIIGLLLNLIRFGYLIDGEELYLFLREALLLEIVPFAIILLGAWKINKLYKVYFFIAVAITGIIFEISFYTELIEYFPSYYEYNGIIKNILEVSSFIYNIIKMHLFFNMYFHGGIYFTLMYMIIESNKKEKAILQGFQNKNKEDINIRRKSIYKGILYGLSIIVMRFLTKQYINYDNLF